MATYVVERQHIYICVSHTKNEAARSDRKSPLTIYLPTYKLWHRSYLEDNIAVSFIEFSILSLVIRFDLEIL